MQRILWVTVALLALLVVVPTAGTKAAPTRHYEYVFVEGTTYVYDIDHRQRLVAKLSMPDRGGVKGVGAAPKSHQLYVAFGGDGGGNGNGALLAYDLVRRKTLWIRHYPFGIDSFDVTRDGRRIYMPTGEAAPGSEWKVLDAANGGVLATIHGGKGPHNTVVGLSGRYAYLGPRYGDHLDVVSTRTNRVVKRVGPLAPEVRPFTINGRETIAFTTASGFLGFQVSSLRSGKVLATVKVKNFSWNPLTLQFTTPSHGVSLSPNERELYLIDTANAYVHVFDVSRPASPRQVADVKLREPFRGNESDCSYDCERDGWLQHSRSGRYVYVGDSGDVIDTRSRKVAFHLGPLRNTRKMLEIDWRGGVPVATSTRQGLGYVR